MRRVTFQLIARALLRKYNIRNIRSIHLAQALSRGHLKVIEQGTILCKEGTDSNEMYVIVQGRVQLLKKNSNGKPTELMMIEGPSLIGQMGLIDGSRRSASCVAAEKTTIIRFSESCFHSLMKEQTINGAAFRHQVMFTMINQLNNTNQKIGALIEEV